MLEGTAASHVARVLRLRAGDPVTLFNGDGWDYEGIVRAPRSDRVAVELTDRVEALPESPLRVTLVQAIARGERMDWVMQKATELGVARIVPVATERSIVRLDGDKADRRLAHWRAVTISACEQCGRARLPEVETPLPFEAWLGRSAGEELRCLLAPAGGPPLASIMAAPAGVQLLVGPEGGLTEAESAAARTAGFSPRSLGPRILRTETAAIVALAVLQSAAGDLR